jgi:tetraacyldisaccharide 4'-kinase
VRFDAVLDRPGLRLALSPLLLPASALYALGVALDRALSSARRRKLPVPTISVGNLTVGGTGKTPVLLRLVADLQKMGRRPFVLTRGYAGVGAPASHAGVVRSPVEAAAFSDEVRLMADLLPQVPIGVGADRVASSDRVLAGGHEDVAVLDDGFQHWRLARDLDIVCIDATDPWGGGFVLPMGRLRETRSNLARAGLVLVTRCERVSPAVVQRIVERVRRASPDAMVLCARFSLSFSSTDGAPAASPARALAVSGIGNPGAFEHSLKSRGVDAVPFRFSDHHAYVSEDWDDIRARARAAGVAVVTTSKDWVKLRRFATAAEPMAILVAVQSLSFDDDLAWDRRVRAVLAGK